MNTFSASECVRFGWQTFKKRPGFFVSVFFVIGLLTGNYGYRTGGADVHFTLQVAILILVAVVIGAAIQTLVGMGKTNLLLKAHDNPETVSWRDVWAPHPFWKYFLTCLAYGLIVLVGFILLIIPGIVWSIKYLFAPYLVMERKLGVREALRESARITHGYKWDLLWLGFLLALVNLLGLLCLVVGLLVSIPVAYLATVHAYRVLEEKARTSAAA